MRKIYTLTPNPALDLTFVVPELTWGEVHHVSQVHMRPGGKGLNTAAVLAQNGVDSTAVGFFSSRQMIDALEERRGRWPARADYVSFPIPWENRVSVCVVAGDQTTVLNQSGPFYPETASDTGTDAAPERDPGEAAQVTRTWDAAWRKVLALDWCEPDSVVSVNGSFPPGTPQGVLTDLVRALRGHGCRVLVDTSGPFLLEAARAGAHLLKPNREELAAALGFSLDTPERVDAGARALLELGAEQVVLSNGEAGLTWYGRVPGVAASGGDIIPVEPGSLCAVTVCPLRRVEGNPTGAGDALVAGLCNALARHEDGRVRAEDLLRGAAWAAGAVAAPVAGEIDMSVASAFLAAPEEWAECHERTLP